jgi:hypothetical protein
VDVAQLGFARNVESEVGLMNAVELQRLFAARGAETFVAVAPFRFPPAEVLAAFPGVDVSFVRLDADDDARRARAGLRAHGAGSGAPLAGDDLPGASADALSAVVEEGARQRRVALRKGERILDTTHLTPLAAAERVLGT